MKLIPAIDLKENKCVRLEKGIESSATIYNEDPVQQAKIFERSECKRIHIVDLDGAFGRKNVNKKTILKIREKINTPIELGGGITTEKEINFWINEGIDYVILGSLSVKNSDLVLSMADKHLNRIYIALDILNEKIMIKGWLEESKITTKDIFNTYNQSSIKGYILTDVSRDGLLKGLDLKLIKKTKLLTKKNIIVGGGLSDYSDIKLLRDNFVDSNIEGFIAGKSIYSGGIKINVALELLQNKKNY